MLTHTKVTKSALNNSLGRLEFFEQLKNGIQGKVENAVFRVQLYTKTIFRITIDREELSEQFSYAVVGTPQAVDFNLEDQENAIFIKTDALVLKIDKDPVRFSFYTTDGKLINQDDPGFGTSWIGEQVTTYKSMQPGERFIGLGEKTGPLDRKGNGYQNWNTDHFGYPPDSDPLYCSTPFYIGLHNQVAYGLFFDNSHKTHFNFGASNNRFSSFSADAGVMDYYFIHQEEVADIIKDYAFLTGTMELPPLWSLGYQQCRYSYKPDKEVFTLAKTFRDKNIPADVIVLDIHYMEQYKIFTWDKKEFPNPQKLIHELSNMGFKIVLICDPGIKVEEHYHTYASGIENDVFITYPDGSYYEGEVWPGWCHFPDFTNPKVRNWWTEQMKAYTELGIEGYWNDMNEIATWGQKLPELMEFDHEGEKASTRKARNVYGMQMARSTYEGAKENLPNKRVFNLTRAGFSGIQRYAAVWTGDNLADDEHMLLGVRLVNSLGITGVPFAGYDIGGFAGEADSHLFARWISIGSFAPFFRAHSMINTRDSEPWAYGEEVEEISRNYINLRYKLMPYIYAAFKEASHNGMPVARSLAINYSHDDTIYKPAYENQYLFGDAIMVAPVASKVSLSKVYLPQGEWYDFYTDVPHNGKQEIIAECPIEKLPVYVKGSSIIPMQETTQSTSCNNNTVLQIHLYKGTEANTVTYYEDDGQTLAYTNGTFHKRDIAFNPKDNSFILQEVEGLYASQFKTIKVYFHGFSSEALKNATVNGNVATTATENFRHIEPISNFDPMPMHESTVLEVKDLPFIELENTNNKTIINW